jgi:hypothetical protein
MKNRARKARPSSELSLPNIAGLIKHGDITLGQKGPIGCVAIASDEDITLAMLVRRKGESLFQLLTRLDQAIQKAYEEDIFTDEINPPLTRSQR